MDWDVGPNRRLVAAKSQPSFDPPPPPKVAPGYGEGVEGSKSKNSLGDNFFFQNADFTKG